MTISELIDDAAKILEAIYIFSFIYIFMYGHILET